MYILRESNTFSGVTKPFRIAPSSGVRIPSGGEAVVAVVELKPGKSCEAQTLIALCGWAASERPSASISAVSYREARSARFLSALSATTIGRMKRERSDRGRTGRREIHRRGAQPNTVLAPKECDGGSR
jgi:hypothetical protein